MAVGPAFVHMSGPSGEQVPLQNQSVVEETLRRLNEEVVLPVAGHFALHYDYLCEQHCQEKKAGITRRQPVIPYVRDEKGELVKETTIRLRLRRHPTVGDPQTEFISRGTQLAVLLHEVAHLRHMDHGKDFMFFLRDLFRHAIATGIVNLSDLTNEIPSPWAWENAIFHSNGDVDDATLLRLHDAHARLQAARACVSALFRRCSRHAALRRRSVGACCKPASAPKRACQRERAPPGVPAKVAAARPSLAARRELPSGGDPATLADALRVGPRSGHLTVNAFGISCMLNPEITGELPPGLKSLKLDFSAYNQVTDGDISDLAPKIPCNLLSLNVDFRFCWNLTDTSVLTLVEGFPRCLQSLSLRGLGSCKMLTDRSLWALAHGLPEGIQALLLDFRYSVHITEEGVDVLREKLPKSLQEVSLDFQDCSRVRFTHLQGT